MVWSKSTYLSKNVIIYMTHRHGNSRKSILVMSFRSLIGVSASSASSSCLSSGDVLALRRASDGRSDRARTGDPHCSLKERTEIYGVASGQGRSFFSQLGWSTAALYILLFSELTGRLCPIENPGKRISLLIATDVGLVMVGLGSRVPHSH
jgi:hypothetical protein